MTFRRVDWAAHYGVSGMIYLAGVVLTGSFIYAWLIALGLGLAKEIIDIRTSGFNVPDLVADILGALSAMLLLWRY